MKSNIKNNSRHIFVSIWAVLLKNFKTVFRSRSSAFTILLGPLLIMTLLILAFNNSSLYDIHIGTYSEGYSELSNKIITKLEGKGYILNRFDNITDCISGVKTNEYNACLVFSKNMEVSDTAQNKITFYIDESRINIVNNIMSSIDKEIMQTSGNVSLELTNVLLNKLSSTKDQLTSKSSVFSAINSNNDKIKSSANNLKSSADSIDLSITYASFNVGALRASIDSINLTYNLSAADYSSLYDKLAAIDNQINASITKVTTAKSKLTDLSSGISGIPAAADDSIKQVDSLKSSIDGIVTDINSISVTNPEEIVNPIKTSVNTVQTQQTYISRFLPMFLVMIIMFVCILLASSLVLSERISTAYLRNSITSTSRSVFLIGAYLSSLIIIIFHLISIAIILNVALGYSIFFLLPSIIPIFLIVSMFILLGIIIGYFANSQETASVVSLVIIAAAIFLSSAILPLETLSLRIKDFILYNPFVISEAVLKKVMIFGFGLDRVFDHIVNLLWYNLILLLLAILGLKLSKSAIKR